MARSAALTITSLISNKYEWNNCFIRFLKLQKFEVRNTSEKSDKIDLIKMQPCISTPTIITAKNKNQVVTDIFFLIKSRTLALGESRKKLLQRRVATSSNHTEVTVLNTGNSAKDTSVLQDSRLSWIIWETPDLDSICQFPD